jgi:menaquinone-dependent protoporphyrinogen IX oxidase
MIYSSTIRKLLSLLTKVTRLNRLPRLSVYLKLVLAASISLLKTIKLARSFSRRFNTALIGKSSSSFIKLIYRASG